MPAEEGTEGAELRWGHGDVTGFVCRCSLGVYWEYTPPAISALLSWEQEGTLGHSLPTYFFSFLREAVFPTSF